MSKNCTNDGCSCTPNMSIKCSVTSCAHHCQDMDNCGLSSIQVGTHENHPSMDQCTDCQSFRKICPRCLSFGRPCPGVCRGHTYPNGGDACEARAAGGVRGLGRGR